MIYSPVVLLIFSLIFFGGCGSLYSDFMEEDFAGIKLSESSITLYQGGTDVQLTATEYPIDPANQPLTWTSNDTNIATVTTSGLVSPGTSVGNSFITVQNIGGTKSAICLVETKVMPSIPAAPSTVWTAIGDGFVDVNWSIVSDADDYLLWSNTINDSATATPGGAVTGTTAHFGGLLNGTTYYFWVKARNIAGISVSFSMVASGTPLALPAQPTLTSVTPGDGQLHAYWNAVPTATGYDVLQNTVNNPVTATVAASNVAVTDYIITPLTNGTNYYIWVRAINGTGTGPESVALMATPAGLPTVITHSITGNPAYVNAINGASGMGGGEVLTANGSPVTSRGICWSTVSGPTTADQITIAGTGVGAYNNIAITGLSPDTVYYVRAFATNAVGTSYGSDASFNSGKPMGTSYGGGYVFHNDGAGSGLVVALADLSSVEIFSDTANLLGTGTAIGNGTNNTNLIIADALISAADTCAVFNGVDAHTDWFIPSSGELDLLHTSGVYLTAGMAGDYYWSSSENTSSDAYLVNFTDGLSYVMPKGNPHWARAVRIF